MGSLTGAVKKVPKWRESKGTGRLNWTCRAVVAGMRALRLAGVCRKLLEEDNGRRASA